MKPLCCCFCCFNLYALRQRGNSCKNMTWLTMVEKSYKWNRWIVGSHGWIFTCLEEDQRLLDRLWSVSFWKRYFRLSYNMKRNWFKVNSLNFSCKEWLNFWSIYVLHSVPPFAFLSVEEKIRLCACLNRIKPLKSPQPKLLDWSISFYLVKLVFSIVSFFVDNQWSHWARCTRRTAVRPGFENVFQQQAAHAAHAQQRSFSIQTESFSSTPKPNKW